MDHSLGLVLCLGRHLSVYLLVALTFSDVSYSDLSYSDSNILVGICLHLQIFAYEHCCNASSNRFLGECLLKRKKILFLSTIQPVIQRRKKKVPF